MLRRARFTAALLTLLAAVTSAADPQPVLEENFLQPLSKKWYWGLGTWEAKDGILRGYESGPRRHGPVKVCRMPMKDVVLEVEFRLVGKAKFAGVIFNGAQERGHILHLVMSTEGLRVIAHPKKGESLDLLKQPHALNTEEWHRVKMRFQGNHLTAVVDGTTLQVEHPCIAEQKESFGLGGESGGPEGLKAGALEFRQLKVSKSP
jgi:hypothetical protein